MRLFRVAYMDPDWNRRGLSLSEPGHPLYVHRKGQGIGRFDNPVHYAGLYAARQPYAAVGEVFGHLRSWPASEIERPLIIGDRTLARTLVELESEVDLIDLDNAATLDCLGWRPSDVVGRDRELTRAHALHEWFRRDETGHGGLSWWSYWRPSWGVAMAWSVPNVEGFGGISIVGHVALSSIHPAVQAAASQLNRAIS